MRAGHPDDEPGGGPGAPPQRDASGDVRYRWARDVALAPAEGPDGNGPGAPSDVVVLDTPRGPVRFTGMDSGQIAVLQALDAGAAEADLLAARGPATGGRGAAWVHLTISRLLQIGAVDRIVGDPPLAVVQVVGRGALPSGRVPDPARPLVLSRFAYLRADGGGLVLESPLATTRLVFTDGRGPAIVGLFGAPTAPQAIAWPAPVDPAAGGALVATLFQEGFLEPAGSPRVPGAAADAAVLDEWEFHDLLFHARSRQGRHREPYGATYRFEGVRPALPAVKEPPAGPRVELFRPDVGALLRADPPFTEVLERRRSWRRPGPTPLTVEDLGELLYRAARVRGRRRTEHEEVSSRPYPGGGADYELELYPVVHRVDGLDRGLYHYDPLGHALVRVAEPGPLVDRFVADTARKAAVPGGAGLPDIVFAVTARIQRLTYKYQSIVYAVALRDLGVLYQTLYLTATAMDLAPCAIGGGDSELFAAASGLSPYAEPHIGEFLLSSRDPDESPSGP